MIVNTLWITSHLGQLKYKDLFLITVDLHAMLQTATTFSETQDRVQSILGKSVQKGTSYKLVQIMMLLHTCHISKDKECHN